MSHIEENDIELVSRVGNCSLDQARTLLIANEGDVVCAIMATEEAHRRRNSRSSGSGDVGSRPSGSGAAGSGAAGSGAAGSEEFGSMSNGTALTLFRNAGLGAAGSGAAGSGTAESRPDYGSGFSRLDRVELGIRFDPGTLENIHAADPR